MCRNEARRETPAERKAREDEMQASRDAQEARVNKAAAEKAAQEGK